MPAYFWDASTVVKRYVQEKGSLWVASLLSPGSNNSIYAARITEVEVVAALSRLSKGGAIPGADLARAVSGIRADFVNFYSVVPIGNSLVQRATQLAGLHALRGYDAVQLAAALEVNDARILALLDPVVIVSADLELNAAAMTEGFVVVDPNSH